MPAAIHVREASRLRLMSSAACAKFAADTDSGHNGGRTLTVAASAYAAIS